MKLRQKISMVWAAFIGTVLFAQQSVAALPDVSAPSRRTSDGNFIKLIQNYAYDLVVLASLAIASIAFLVVSKNVITTYGEIQKDRKSWGDLGSHFAVGAVLLVAVVFLMDQLTGIL